MTTGKRIRTLRKEKDMTQYELATAIGAWQQNVSKWEKNQAAPTYRQANAMANLFNVSIDEICDEYSSRQTYEEVEEGIENITKDVALEYIGWNQMYGNQSLKATIISMGCLALGFIICELAQYGIPNVVVLVGYLIAMVVAVFFARRIGLKKEMPEFAAIESGEFHLTSDAEEMVRHRKEEITESVRTTGNIGTFGLLILLLWFFDTAFDAGWAFSNQMIIFYLIGLAIIVALTIPTMNYWRSIRRLLRENGPQIVTPLDKAFWRS